MTQLEFKFPKAEIILKSQSTNIEVFEITAKKVYLKNMG